MNWIGTKSWRLLMIVFLLLGATMAPVGSHAGGREHARPGETLPLNSVHPSQERGGATIALDHGSNPESAGHLSGTAGLPCKTACLGGAGGCTIGALASKGASPAQSEPETIRYPSGNALTLSGRDPDPEPRPPRSAA